MTALCPMKYIIIMYVKVDPRAVAPCLWLNLDSKILFLCTSLIDLNLFQYDLLHIMTEIELTYTGSYNWLMQNLIATNLSACVSGLK